MNDCIPERSLPLVSVESILNPPVLLADFETPLTEMELASILPANAKGRSGLPDVLISCVKAAEYAYYHAEEDKPDLFDMEFSIDDVQLRLPKYYGTPQRPDVTPRLRTFEVIAGLIQLRDLNLIRFSKFDFENIQIHPDLFAQVEYVRSHAA